MLSSFLDKGCTLPWQKVSSVIVSYKCKYCSYMPVALTVQVNTPSRKLLAGEEAPHASAGTSAHTASATSSTLSDPADVWLQSFGTCELCAISARQAHVNCLVSNFT